MNATPERAKNDKSEAPQISRLERMRNNWTPDGADQLSREAIKKLRDQYMPDMPPLDRADYLIAYLFDVGPVVDTGQGAVQLRSEHLIAWQQETGIRLQALESRFLRSLSIAYLNESRRAEKLGCEPPWRPEGAKPEPTAAQIALRALAADK